MVKEVSRATFTNSSKSDLFSPGLQDLRGAALVLAVVLILSPVLKTLTDSISTDTIYAMTVSIYLSRVIVQVRVVFRKTVVAGD